MLQEIEAKRGISLQDIDKIDIIRGKLYLYDDQGATLLEEPIRDFHGAALKGCDECADFLGRRRRHLRRQCRQRRRLLQRPDLD